MKLDKENFLKKETMRKKCYERRKEHLTNFQRNYQ